MITLHYSLSSSIEQAYRFIVLKSISVTTTNTKSRSKLFQVTLDDRTILTESHGVNNELMVFVCPALTSSNYVLLLIRKYTVIVLFRSCCTKITTHNAFPYNIHSILAEGTTHIDHSAPHSYFYFWQTWSKSQLRWKNALLFDGPVGKGRQNDDTHKIRYSSRMLSSLAKIYDIASSNAIWLYPFFSGDSGDFLFCCSVSSRPHKLSLIVSLLFAW